MTRPSDDPPANRRLRRVALGVVAAALIVAGGAKLWRPDGGLTMTGRYLDSPRAIRAGGCLEIALAFWLLSGRSAKLAPATAAGALAGLGLLVGMERWRERPLPCGCFPMRTVAGDTAAVRRELSVAMGRDVFLVVLCGVAFALAPDEAGGGRAAFDRMA